MRFDLGFENGKEINWLSFGRLQILVTGLIQPMQFKMSHLDMPISVVTVMEFLSGAGKNQ